MFQKLLKQNKPSWIFPSSKGLQLESVNNAAIETFKSNPLSSLAREICQNSLDAVDDLNQPVIVSFDAFNLPSNEFPNINEFKSIFKDARHTWQNRNGQVIEFIDRAEKTLNTSTIPILKISDYNTKGLEGAERRDIGTPWSTLIKEKGSSNKSDTSGGSFGIGKAAPFACSDLRTLFYSTCIYENKERYHIGVSNVMSFEKQDQSVTQGVGFYSLGEFTESIQGDLEFIKHPRTEKGTDIYIAGFNKQVGWQEAIIESILVNFFITIWKQKLIVKVGNQEINSDSLGTYINKLPDQSIFGDTKDYYELLTSNETVMIPIKQDDYGKEFGYDDDEAILYLLKKKPANRRILMTRSTGMRLFEQKNISSSIYFTGILMIEGKHMNVDFKKMENPAHDDWSPERYIEDPRKAKRMLSQLKRYNKEKVIELFQEKVTDEMDAVGISDFLPDTNMTNAIGSVEKKETMNKKIEKVKIKKQTKSKKTSVTQIETTTDDFETIETEPDVMIGNIIDGDTGGGKNTETDGSPGEGTDEVGQGGGTFDVEPDDNGEEHQIPTPHKKNLVHPKHKIISTNATTGEYALMIKSDRGIKNPIIEVFIIGEQSYATVEIKNVEMNNEKQLFTKNRFQCNAIEKNTLTKINIAIDFDKLVRIGVKVYESKK